MQQRMREERKRKKLIKVMKKMDKKPRIPIPLLELEVDPQLKEEAKILRIRSGMKISEEEAEKRALMIKKWNTYANQRHRREIAQHDAILTSRYNALTELRAEDYELYAKAIQPDPNLIPFRAEGPTATPPPLAATFAEEHVVDGHYEDTTRQYQVQYQDPKEYMKAMLARSHRRKKSGLRDDDDDD